MPVGGKPKETCFYLESDKKTISLNRCKKKTLKKWKKNLQGLIPREMT